ncbi:Fpg/Nei family DNA glycosylase [Jiangella anatolica]|uniref:Formamidopyrimidine-DNA glycosylase n=1 Tax=Jiangella anatolica TaxID=2670374 RepID=A0A2W2BZE2_9ACTN|nr:DNA-formamidopyrimidine glycosylase family protein [Jiangella anatolica]PZF81037.1 formamidopyrimidine-DNA glycosylase [Jiangella anatolica]
MPELPDVEAFRRVLRRAAGAPIEHVEVLDPGVLRGVDAAELRDALTGTVFATPRRHGKWLIGPVRAGPRHRRDEPSVVFHFGMTGSLTWVDGDTERHPHDRVVIRCGARELRYRDLRKLQGIRLMPDDDGVGSLLRDLGPDAAHINPAELGARLARRQRTLKPALTDQGVVAGLGNLLADEILWRARVHPRRGTRDLTDADRRRLHRTMTIVLRRSSRVGRVPGWDDWLTGHRDDRNGACPRCGTPLRRTRLGGRTTVWCPHCQAE